MALLANCILCGARSPDIFVEHMPSRDRSLVDCKKCELTYAVSETAVADGSKIIEAPYPEALRRWIAKEHKSGERWPLVTTIRLNTA
jgi:hypothetical protein